MNEAFLDSAQSSKIIHSCSNTFHVSLVADFLTEDKKWEGEYHSIQTSFPSNAMSKFNMPKNSSNSTMPNQQSLKIPPSCRMSEYNLRWEPMIDPEWEKTAGKRIKEELDRRMRLEEERLVRVKAQPFYNRAFIPRLASPTLSSLRPMPFLTIAEAQELISQNLFVGKDSTRLFIQVNSREEVDCLENSQFYQDMIATIDEYRIASFDTEGKPSATALIVGDLKGRVIAINNLATTGIPNTLKPLMENRQVRWVQSAIEEDVDLLKKYVDVQAWVDSGLIYRACVFDEEDSRFGTCVQGKFVGQEEFPYCKKLGSKKIVYLCNFHEGDWKDNERFHVCQDARAPLALVLKATVNYMTEYGYDGHDNIMPFLNNLLHSFVNLHHYSKPIFTRFRSGERPWLPKPEIQNEDVFIGGTSIVHDLNRITAERRALCQYSTDLSTPSFGEPPQLFLGDYQKQAENNWEGFELPWEGSQLTWTRFCRVCGGNHRRCPIRESNSAMCLYPLCARPQQSHTTKVCKTLHRWCQHCGLRGHLLNDHNKYCMETLQRVFLKWSPFGLYTSLVYLNPNCDYYWKFFLYGVGVIDHKVAREAGIDFYSSEDMEVVIVVEESDERAIEAAVEEAMVEMAEDEVAGAVVAEEEVIELEPSANDRFGLDSEDESSVPPSLPSVTSSVTSSVTLSVTSSVVAPSGASSVASLSVVSSKVSAIPATTNSPLEVGGVGMTGLISQLVTSLEEPIRKIAQETARAVVGDAVQKVREEMETKRKSSQPSKTVKKQRK